jgi:uncharacterized Zn-binding protein involved in type VI secretion
MGKPAAKKGDRVVGIDTHVVMVPSPAGPVPTPTPMPFDGVLDGALSPDVEIHNQAAATKGSTATNTPAHVAAGGPFQTPPKDRATIEVGSATVEINNKAAARLRDVAMTCNDPDDAPRGTVISGSTVFVGD